MLNSWPTTANKPANQPDNHKTAVFLWEYSGFLCIKQLFNINISEQPIISLKYRDGLNKETKQMCYFAE